MSPVFLRTSLCFLFDGQHWLKDKEAEEEEGEEEEYLRVRS